ncbi:MAG: diguanylate cyclase [bacterium]
MEHEDKTKEQLINELNELQHRITELEKAETARSLVEDALQKSKEEFKLAFEDASDAIFWADPENGLIVNCNKTAEILLEKKREEIVGYSQTAIHPPQKAEYYANVFKKHIEEKGAVDEGAEIITKSGKIKPVHITASITTVGGKAIVQGVFRDITERKQAEQLQVSIYKISEAAHSTDNLEELFRAIHDIIGELMPAKNFYIALYDKTTQTINFSYFVDELDKTPAPRKLGKGITEYVIRTEKPLLASPEVFKKLKKRGDIEVIGTPDIDWLGVPLRISATIIGVLAVQSYSEGIRYSKKDVNILRFVSDQVAMAIERKRADEALRESEERLSVFMDSAPNAFALFDSKLNLVELNNVGVGMLPAGANKEDVVGKHITELYPEIKEKERYVKYSDVVKTGKLISVDDVILHPQFGEMYLNVNAFKVGEGLGLIITDITERKQAERKLRTLATTDTLTEVLNRGFGLLLFGKQLQLAKRNKSKLSICYIDVDGLKEVNDTYGHQEGDEVLKMVGSFLKKATREIDIVCRLGGDEFLLVLPQCSIDQAFTAWGRIAQKETDFNTKGIKPYKISLSRGFAECDPDREKTVDQLIAIADHEMYKHKHSKSV